MERSQKQSLLPHPSQRNGRLDEPPVVCGVALRLYNRLFVSLGWNGALAAYNDLREWIAALDKAGELKRVSAETDPISQ